MATKFLSPPYLSDDFRIGEDHKVYRNKRVIYYTGNFGSGTTTGTGTDDFWKRRIFLSDNFGIIHIDFKRTNTNNGTVLTLPTATPTPVHTLQVQTWDGGIVWCDAGSRTVQCSGLAANRRYIVNLTGFFQET